MLNNKREALKILKYDFPYVKENLSDRLRQHKNFMMDAIKINGKMALIASPELQKDPDIGSLAGQKCLDFRLLKSFGNSISDYPILLDNKEFVKNALISSATISSENIVDDRNDYYKEASSRIRNDKEMTLFAVNINAGNFLYTSDILKDDKDVVKTVIDKNPLFIFSASKNKQNEYFEECKKELLDFAENKCKNSFITDTRHDKLIIDKNLKEGYILNMISFSNFIDITKVNISYNEETKSLGYAGLGPNSNSSKTYVFPNHETAKNFYEKIQSIIESRSEKKMSLDEKLKQAASMRGENNKSNDTKDKNIDER